LFTHTVVDPAKEMLLGLFGLCLFSNAFSTALVKRDQVLG
jgi:hypothetical protein